MIEVAVVLSVVFGVVLILDGLIVIAIVLASCLAIVAEGSADSTVLLASRMAGGGNSFALLAIPFFIFSAN